VKDEKDWAVPGQVIFMKTVTNREPGQKYLISEISLVQLLKRKTKNALTQYIRDTTLRAIILKFKYTTIGNLS